MKGRMISIIQFCKFRIFVKRIISVICVMIILISSLCYFNKLLIRKDSLIKYRPFFESEQEFDVLFFGSSHVINGISPLDLFYNYGITSYNMSMHANYISENYYLLKETIDDLESKGKKLPQIVVLDIYTYDIRETYCMHKMWDDFQITPTKIEMINNLIVEEEKSSMLVPFILYHSRWNEISEEDFQPQLNKLYGTELKYGMTFLKDNIIVSTENRKIKENTAVYLDKIQELCKSKDILLVLIQIPYSISTEDQLEANGVYRYAKEHDIFIKNYVDENIGLDFAIDFINDGHLNCTGMRTMTNEIGRLLVELGIDDHRAETEAAQWSQAYEEYIKFRVAEIKEIKDVKTYLMALNDPDLISTIRLYKGMLGDMQISKLIERLRTEGHQIIVTEERPEIKSEDGRSKRYDVYCEVYRRSGAEALVHKTGFTL